MKKKKFFNVLKITSYILIIFLYFLVSFIHERFGDISFEHLLFNIINTKGANYDIVFVGAKYILLRVIIIILIVFLIKLLCKIIYNKIKINNKITEKIQKLKNNFLGSLLVFLVLFSFVFISSYKMLKIDKYVESQKNISTIFEDYYVDGRNVELKFPKKKRNLIYIFLESMEMTNVSIENGGNFPTSYIPKLEKLALDNINFSNTNKLGGAYQVNNTGWTIAALIAQTSGTPLKLSINDNINTIYDQSLPGIYNLGDILYDNGYNNYFMIGSDANFGNRRDYFETHGNYAIYDYYSAIDEEYIEEDYFVWWGYEDKRMLELAKEKIIDASKQEEPFNFTILTVDTHFTDGYLDESCETIFDNAYANSLYCSDTMIYSFVKWIEKQDFYDNTTIILSGDHLTMQDNFYENNDYQRTTYNTFINSAITPKKEKNREFSTFDMFPTTLAALGVKIDGNKLGLGTNLFSNEKTLTEELGYENFNQEIQKKSVYYNSEIINETIKEIE